MFEINERDSVAIPKVKCIKNVRGLVEHGRFALIRELITSVWLIENVMRTWVVCLKQMSCQKYINI